jgi:hypothetical protein
VSKREGELTVSPVISGPGKLPPLGPASTVLHRGGLAIRKMVTGQQEQEHTIVPSRREKLSDSV